MLQGLADAPDTPPGPGDPGDPAPLADLGAELEQAAASIDGLAVRLRLVPVTLPAPVADQIVACAGAPSR